MTPVGDLLTLPPEADREPVAWGYARVSTPEQDPGMQVATLIEAGVAQDRILVDVASGARASRPRLDFLLRQLRAGDVVTVWKLDRLGRSLSHLVRLGEELKARQVEVRSLTEGIDTRTPGGRLSFGMLAVMAEYERDLARERTAAALARARATGRQLGRPCRVTPEQHRLIVAMRRAGETYPTIAATTGLSTAIVGRVARGEIASLAKNSVDTTGELPFYEGTRA